jgi:hypothetical protein
MWTSTTWPPYHADQTLQMAYLKDQINIRLKVSHARLRFFAEERRLWMSSLIGYPCSCYDRMSGWFQAAEASVVVYPNRVRKSESSDESSNFSSLLGPQVKPLAPPVGLVVYQNLQCGTKASTGDVV